jgi:hypothetical protein
MSKIEASKSKQRSTKHKAKAMLMPTSNALQVFVLRRAESARHVQSLVPRSFAATPNVDPMHVFDQIDTNHDGVLIKVESKRPSKS